MHKAEPYATLRIAEGFRGGGGEDMEVIGNKGVRILNVGEMRDGSATQRHGDTKRKLGHG